MLQFEIIEFSKNKNISKNLIKFSNLSICKIGGFDIK